MEYSDDLNKSQRKAVEIVEGPVMVVAGPGTGKTKLLVSKIVHLLNLNKVRAHEVVAITFTRKAAQEIKSRLLDQKIESPVHTFHSFAIEILKEAGLKDLQIIDEEKRLKIAGSKERMLLISNYKNRILHSDNDKKVKAIVEEYDSQLKNMGLLDFDDLITKAYELINKDTQYKYVLVDEFQDTNLIQYEFLKLLLKKHQNITVIGDPKQAIYSFRGAISSIFEKFLYDFPKAVKVNLDINYRSSREILDVSTRLYDDIDLTPFTKDSGEVVLIRTMNQYSEADWILGKISQLMEGLDLTESSDLGTQGADKNNRFSDFAVVFRTHSSAKALETKLREVAIPYQKVGEGSVFKQKRVASVVDAIKAIYLNQDSFQLYKNKSLLEIVDEISNPEEDIDFIEFRNSLRRFNVYDDPVGKFIDYVDNLEKNEYYDASADKVTLLTIHAAKGLEFKYVFICGLEEGLIPHTFEGQTNEELEEEKRLLYVAMTRAKRGLYLLNAKERLRKQQEESRFITQLICSDLKQQIDTQIDRIVKKRAKHKARKSQMGLGI